MKLATAATLWALPLLACAQAAPVEEVPEEIIVVGRQPGPPMWRVYNGENVLWILPLLAPIPEDMVWETDKVATVIAASQEVIGIPDVNVSTSPLLLLNPVNYVRGYRLMKRLTRNEDDATLDEVLNPDLYARFTALQAKYSLDEDEFEELRPMVAAGKIQGIVMDEEGLDQNPDTMKILRRLLRRNRDLVHTDIQLTIEIEGNYRSLADRAENFMANLDPVLEVACFESQLLSLEQDLPDMKARANAWAQGHADVLRDLPVARENSGPCFELAISSTENELMQQVDTDQMWLDAAEKALATNASTFAMLPISEVLAADGLFNRLKAKGYQVREP